MGLILVGRLVHPAVVNLMNYDNWADVLKFQLWSHIQC